MDISGITFKEEQLENKLFISVTLLVIHLDIYGNVFKEKQLENK